MSYRFQRFNSILNLSIKNKKNFFNSRAFNKMSETNNFKIRAINRQFVGFTKDDEKWSGPFFFIQSADTQLGLIDDYFKNPNPNWEKEIILTRQAIKAANEMNPKPKFFIVCGDLVNAMPGHVDRKAQIIDFKKCFDELNNQIPLVCVCGNHDVGDTPTPHTIKLYREEFGDDYFSFSCGGVLFVVLNSQYYANSSLVPEQCLAQEKWLDSELQRFKANSDYKHLIVFHHIPWFLKDPNEDNQYFNIDKDLRLKMLDKLYDAGVRHIFTGHYHRNAGGMYKDMEVVVTSAIGAQLGDDKSGFRIVKVRENSVQHQYYALEDVPKDIDV